MECWCWNADYNSLRQESWREQLETTVIGQVHIVTQLKPTTDQISGLACEDDIDSKELYMMGDLV